VSAWDSCYKDPAFVCPETPGIPHSFVKTPGITSVRFCMKLSFPRFSGRQRAQLYATRRRCPEFLIFFDFREVYGCVIFVSICATRGATLCNFQNQNPWFSRPFRGFLRNTQRNNVQLMGMRVALPPPEGGAQLPRNSKARKTPAGETRGGSGDGQRSRPRPRYALTKEDTISDDHDPRLRPVSRGSAEGYPARSRHPAGGAGRAPPEPVAARAMDRGPRRP
jgi:hypothetical protein